MHLINNQVSGVDQYQAKSDPILLSRCQGTIHDTVLESWTPDQNSLATTLSIPLIGTKDGPYFLRTPGTKRNNIDTSDTANVIILDGDSRIGENGEIISGAPAQRLVHIQLARLGCTHFIYASHSNGATREEVEAKGIDDTGGAYDANYHKYRVVIPCTYNREQLPALLGYLFREMHKAGVMLADVKENHTWAQAWYFPRIPDQRRKDLFKFNQHIGSSLDVEAIFADWLKTNPASIVNPAYVTKILDDVSRRDVRIISSDNGSSIYPFLESHDLIETLESFGYIKKGKDRWLCPNSTSGIAGVLLCRNCKDGRLRFYSTHGSDPLNDEKPKDAFDIYRILGCGGDMKTALNWNPEITKHNQRLFKQEQAKTTQQAQQPAYQEPSIDHESGKCVMTSTVEPFPGLMTEIVNSALEDAHKPQKELTILSVLLGMSSACTGEYILPGGGRLNLYGTGIAGNGCGKEHPRNVAELIAGAGCCQVIGQPGSGAGLEDLLESNKNFLLGIDEIAHLLDAINGSQKPPYLIDLAGNLLRLFTASKGIYRTRALAKGKGCVESAKSIHHPCVNLLGFATPEKLGKAVGVGNIEDGLLGRVLFAMGSDGIKPRRVRHQFLLPCSVIERVKEIGRFTQDVHISMTTDANSLLDSLLIDFDSTALKATTLFERALKMRSFEKCERIAGVLAVWDDPEKPLVNVDHVKWAANFVKYSDNTVIRFCAEFMHGGEVQTNAALINKTMKRVLDGELIPSKAKEAEHIKAKRLPWTFVLKASRLSKKDFDDAVNYLVDLGEIEVTTVLTKEMNGREYKTRILSRVK